MICSLNCKKGFYTKVPYVLNFKRQGEVLLYFLLSLTLHLTYYLFQPFCKLSQYARYTRQMKDYLRSYYFNSLNLCQKCNLKNIDLTWVTLENNNKFDALHNFTFLDTLWQDPHFLKRLYTTVHNVNLQSLQITPSKKCIIIDFFFQLQH